MLPPLVWLPQVVADVTGLALGLALVAWERRGRAINTAVPDVAASPTAPR